MIGIRELRADLARHVRRASAGERTVITVDGRPAAALSPLAESGGSIESLVAAGGLLPPRRSGPPRARPPIPVWTGVRLDRSLRDLRG